MSLLTSSFISRLYNSKYRPKIHADMVNVSDFHDVFNSSLDELFGEDVVQMSLLYILESGFVADTLVSWRMTNSLHFYPIVISSICIM